MTLGKIHDILVVYAAGPGMFCPEGVRLFANFAREFRLINVGQLEPAGPIVAEQKRGTEAARRKDLARDLRHVQALVKSAGGSTGLVQELGLLIELLDRDSGYVEPMLEHLKSLLRPPQLDVSAIVDQLRAAERTPRFEAVYDDLVQAAPTLAQLQDIALRMTGAKKKPATKKAALASIRRSHDMFMTAKRGIDASGGRSAA